MLVLNMKCIPFDGEACYTWLLCQNLPLHLLDDRLRRRVESDGLVCVLVVYVVAYAHKFAVLIAATQQNHRHADDLTVGDAQEIRGVGTEDKFVDADWKWADENRVKLLVILVSVKC